MKKFIIIAVTLLAFFLVSCKDKGEDSEGKCGGIGEWDSNKKECVAKYTITNQITNMENIAVKVGMQVKGYVLLLVHECVKVEKSQFVGLRISVDDDTLCDNTDTKHEDCSLGSYEVVAVESSNSDPVGSDKELTTHLRRSTKSKNINCKELPL